MVRGKALWLWGWWLLSSAAFAGCLAFALTRGENKTVFMPGELTAGHHQLSQACRACHRNPFGGVESLQEACVECHGDVRKKPFDSHPKAKFTDPRNADRLGKIDALHCTTCHTEHRPEITAKNGLTQPADFCVHCHRDVAKDRPSHEGLAFSTCRDSGCHNFHDNQALYTDFLVKHLDEPATRPAAAVPAREFGSVVDAIVDYPRARYPRRALSLTDADGPDSPDNALNLRREWLDTAHSRSGVNCSACHVITREKAANPAWDDHPDQRGCGACHGLEVARFMKGKHGMRIERGLSPMTPAAARLPMVADAHEKPLTCTACHGAHAFDSRRAAAEACLGCHRDEHSLAYKASSHYRVWQQELAGTAPSGSGVSCATCHMPRVRMDVDEFVSRIVVDHNQSATLSPNSKMIRPACLHCHGLGFSIDALADPALITNNFAERPRTKVPTMSMAAEYDKAQREKRATQDGEADDLAGMFGF
ncbi:MAG: cytochrome c3 family protein [Nitrospirota bacterium]